MFARLHIATAIAVVCGAVSLIAQQFPAEATLQTLIKDRVDSQRSTGIVVGLLEPDGKTRVMAYNERRHGEPVFDARTVFEIGSITKVFTTSILADMVSRGEVGLDDPVAKFLPATVKMPSRGGREITLRELATQTSGLPRMPNNFAPKDPTNPYADYTADRMFAFLSSYSLTRDIGERYEYSNLGVGLLGEALARRTGMSYEALVTARILRPLRMMDTTITLSPELRSRLAAGHAASGALAPNWDLLAFAGAGALRSTAEDMLKFVSAQLNPGSSTLAKNMTLTHPAQKPTGPEGKIGLGWHIRIRPDREIRWHNGGTGGYRTFFGFDAAKRRGVVVLTNANTPAGGDDIGFHLLAGRPLASFPPPKAA